MTQVEERKLVRERDDLQAKVGKLELTIATQRREMHKLAMAERERWMTALAPEVDPIQARIIGRMPK